MEFLSLVEDVQKKSQLWHGFFEQLDAFSGIKRMVLLSAVGGDFNRALCLRLVCKGWFDIVMDAFARGIVVWSRTNQFLVRGSSSNPIYAPSIGVFSAIVMSSSFKAVYWIWYVYDILKWEAKKSPEKMDVSKKVLSLAIGMHGLEETFRKMQVWKSPVTVNVRRHLFSHIQNADWRDSSAANRQKLFLDIDVQWWLLIIRDLKERGKEHAKLVLEYQFEKNAAKFSEFKAAVEELAGQQAADPGTFEAQFVEIRNRYALPSAVVVEAMPTEDLLAVEPSNKKPRK